MHDALWYDAERPEPWPRRQEAVIVTELLAELFSSRVRSAVLALLLPRPHLAYSLTEMSRRLVLPVSSLQHECYKLSRLGVLCDERRGNARLYRPDNSWPMLGPLTALVVAALPMEEAIGAATEGVSGLEDVWVASERSTRSETSFLVVVGSLDVETVDGIFDRARIAIAPNAGQRVELAYFRPADWRTRLASGDGFAASLAAGKQVFLAGTAYDAAYPPQ